MLPPQALIIKRYAQDIYAQVKKSLYTIYLIKIKTDRTLLAPFLFQRC